jgi:hypothetical protein
MMPRQKKIKSNKTLDPCELNANETMIQNNRQETNTELINLLGERKRLLTEVEKEIVQQTFNCNDQNKNDIIIRR